MTEKINLHVGSLDDMGQRFVNAWHQLEAGATVEARHLTFFSLESMLATISPKRLALLRHVRQQPATSIADLARALGRDYKRVHEDVTALTHAGLIVRDADGIRAPFDSVQAIVALDA
jgi:predicted transcriptional regulator